MKRVFSILLACLFVCSLAAQSSTGGIYFKNSLVKHSLPNGEERYWAKNKQNNQYRDLYVCMGRAYKICVLDASGKDITQKCTYTSSNEEVAKVSSDKRLLAYKAGGPVTITAKDGDAKCTILVYSYSKNNFTIYMEGDNAIKTNPSLPVARGAEVAYVDKSCNDKNFKGMNVLPYYVLEYYPATEKYKLICKQTMPGYKYKIEVRMNDTRQVFERCDTMLGKDLKPGDYVVYNAAKKRYEAYDGGLRGRTRNISIDVTPFRDKVVGIVAGVFEATPDQNCQGIYTSDGKKHHALVIDLVECDRKWVYNSEATIIDVPCTNERGLAVTRNLTRYNTRRGASHRIKPIYWIQTCNETHKTMEGATEWYLPTTYEVNRINLRAVNASIGRLIKAGRTDISRVRVGSNYWTCVPFMYDHKTTATDDQNYSYAWEFIDEPGRNEVIVTKQARTKEFFVRAFFSL